MSDEIMPPVLPESDPAELDRLLRMVSCGSIDPRDFPDWERVLKKSNRRNIIRTQMQSWTDCQAQSLCAGEEAREAYVTRLQPTERSDSYTYAACELIDQGRIGRNHGSTITSGVELLVEGAPRFDLPPGMPTEADWPYRNYKQYTSTHRFQSAARGLDLKQTHVDEHQPALPFEQTLVALAAGATVHIGTYWAPRWVQAPNGMKEMAEAPKRGGGHATEALDGIFLNGKWYIYVHNSHGRGNHYVIGERVWNQLADMRFAPFGGFQIQPDRIEERFTVTADEAKGKVWV